MQARSLTLATQVWHAWGVLRLGPVGLARPPARGGRAPPRASRALTPCTCPAPACLPPAVSASYRLATACFFGGILFTALLDACVHAMMHWAARRRRRVASKRSPPGSASTADLVHSRASPAASDSGEEGGGGGGGEAPPGKLAGATQPRLRCSSCAAIYAARSAAGEAVEGSGDEKEMDVEMGSIAAASVDPLWHGGSPDSADAPPLRCCTRHQPCCAGNPDCCGPTARCYNTGAGPAAAEILPGTEAAEVVAVLQADPHTKDLLRMGERLMLWLVPTAAAGCAGRGLLLAAQPRPCNSRPARSGRRPSASALPTLACHPACRHLHWVGHRAAQPARGPRHVCGRPQRHQGAPLLHPKTSLLFSGAPVPCRCSTAAALFYEPLHAPAKAADHSAAALPALQVGASIAAAIAIHNVPEGICVALPIYYATGSRWKVGWCGCV